MPHKPAPFGPTPLPPPPLQLYWMAAPQHELDVKNSLSFEFLLLSLLLLLLLLLFPQHRQVDEMFIMHIGYGTGPPGLVYVNAPDLGDSWDIWIAWQRVLASLKGAAINYNYLVVLYVKLCLTCPPSWQAGRQADSAGGSKLKTQFQNWHNQCARAAREVNLIYGSTLGRGLQRALEQWGINYRAAYDSFQFTIELKHFECLNEAKKRLKRNLKRKIRKLSKD